MTAVNRERWESQTVADWTYKVGRRRWFSRLVLSIPLGCPVFIGRRVARFRNEETFARRLHETSFAWFENVGDTFMNWWTGTVLFLFFFSFFYGERLGPFSFLYLVFFSSFCVFFFVVVVCDTFFCKNIAAYNNFCIRLK